MDFNKLTEFYKGKRVLLTGHTGFKGSWMAVWLHEMGAKVTGISLDPVSAKDNYVLCDLGNKITDIRADIRDGNQMKQIFMQFQPEIVFHFAAQSIVRLSYDIPVETYEINVNGTIHIMEAIRNTQSVQSAVMITTDKCYENIEQNYAYRENDPLGGFDPYSSSKGAAEIAISSWRRSYSLPLASARAGNVIGGGDWAPDRIIPDCIRAIEAGNPIKLRSPKSVRPWQHVLEPLSGYLLLAMKLYEEPQKYNQAWNFGPQTTSVSTVLEIATGLVDSFGKGVITDESDSNQPHEANLLMLDITKAQEDLGWVPLLSLSDSIELTSEWYKRYQTGNVYALCVEQIKRYVHES